MVSTPIAQPATPEVTTEVAKGSQLSLVLQNDPNAIDVHRIAESDVTVVKLKDLYPSDFVEGEPSPLKLADGIFLKAEDGSTQRLDTFTFKQGLSSSVSSADLRREAQKAKTPEAAIKAITSFMVKVLDKVGDYSIKDALAIAKTRDKKPETLFEGLTGSDAIIIQEAMRFHVNKKNPCDYAIQMAECGCGRQVPLIDVAERNEDGDDITELHSIEEFSIRYYKKANQWTGLPLYGVKLPEGFRVLHGDQDELIDEIYLRPMLLRELSAYFESSGGKKGGNVVIDTAKELNARVAAMPQCSATRNNPQGSIFGVEFYNYIPLDSVAVLEQALVDLSRGRYFGSTQNLTIKFNCFDEKCPVPEGKKLEAPVNWFNPYDFVYASSRPRPQ